MWLLHRPTGKAVFLGKRLAEGWYAVPENLQQRIELLFKTVELESPDKQDDFCIALEDAEGAELATDKWTYGGEIIDISGLKLTILCQH